MVNDIAWHNILNEEISVGHLFIQIMTQVSFFRRGICELGFSELGTSIFLPGPEKHSSQIRRLKN